MRAEEGEGQSAAAEAGQARPLPNGGLALLGEEAPQQQHQEQDQVAVPQRPAAGDTPTFESAFQANAMAPATSSTTSGSSPDTSLMQSARLPTLPEQQQQQASAGLAAGLGAAGAAPATGRRRACRRPPC